MLLNVFCDSIQHIEWVFKLREIRHTILVSQTQYKILSCFIAPIFAKMSHFSGHKVQNAFLLDLEHFEILHDIHLVFLL